MARSTKAAWLEGPGDLEEADVEDVPVPGQSVRVRGLPAAFSNDAQSAAVEQRQVGVDTINIINKGRMEIIQFARGVIDPTFTIEEAEQIAQKYGPAFNKVIAKIDELSAVDKEAVDEANARFQTRGEAEGRPVLGNGAGAGDGGSDVRVRAGAGTEDELG